MTGKSNITFDIVNAKNITLFFDSLIEMDAESTLDFDAIPKHAMIVKLDTTSHDHDAVIELGSVIFSRSFEVEVDQLTILNDLKDIDVEEGDKSAGRIGLWTNDLTIGEGVKLEAPKIVLFANDSLKIEKDV